MTNGCRFQEKSFSVSMAGKIVGYCSRCQKEITGTIYKYNGEELCVHCFQNIPSKNISREGISGFLTTKDKLFDFVDINTTGKPVEIRTKRQWQNHLKEHKLTDDIPKKWSKPGGIEKKEPQARKGDYTKLIAETFRERNRIRI